MKNLTFAFRNFANTPKTVCFINNVVSQTGFPRQTRPCSFWTQSARPSLSVSVAMKRNYEPVCSILSWRLPHLRQDALIYREDRPSWAKLLHFIVKTALAEPSCSNLSWRQPLLSQAAPIYREDRPSWARPLHQAMTTSFLNHCSLISLPFGATDF